MRFLVLLAILAAAPVRAELYRWVDPQSGSIKYSSVPPPWYGEDDRPRGAPPVEVLRYGEPRRPPRAEGADAADRSVAALEARWRELLQSVAALGRSPDAFADPEARRRVEAYQALAAELDRRDPGGRERRAAEAMRLLQAAAR